MSNLASSVARSAISIPTRIKRSPTDLLKALSEAVKLDTKSPSYKFIDDPFSIPISQNEKKIHSLSKASGIKAARFMINKYPKAFYKDECEPHVPAFFPKKVFSEEELKYPCEDLIFSQLEWGNNLVAFDTYLKCKDEKIEISEACKLALLDVLCINNNANMIDALPAEEYFYVRSNNINDFHKLVKSQTSKWKENSEAEVVFADLKEKSAAAYCSLIKGMVMALEQSKARSLYQEMLEKNLTPDIETINAMIFLNTISNIARDEKIENLLKNLNEIKRFGLKPNLKTFNNSFYLLSTISRNRKGLNIALNLLDEMKQLGIESSLSTWSNIVRFLIFESNKELNHSFHSYIMSQVEELNKKGLEWCDDWSGEFFVNAINNFLNSSSNFDLLKRLHDVLMSGTNIRFLAYNLNETRYFERYFQGLINLAPPEKVFEEWNKLIPHTLSPNASLTEMVLDHTINYGEFPFLPKFWSDIQSAKSLRGLTKQQVTLFHEKFLGFLNSVPKEALYTVPGVVNQCGDIIRKLVQANPFEPSEDDRESDFNWTGTMLSYSIEFLVKINDFETAWQYFQAYLNTKTGIIGELNEPCLQALLDKCIEMNDAKNALNVIDIMSYLLYPSAKNNLKVLSTMLSLDPEQKKFLETLNTKLNMIKQSDKKKL